MNSIFSIIQVANAPLSISGKLNVMVTTIGITLGIMALIAGVLYAVPYIAGEKKFKNGKKTKNK